MIFGKKKHPIESHSYAVVTGAYVGEMLIFVEEKENDYKYISIPNYVRSRLGGKKKVNEFIDGLLILISFIKFFFIKND